MIITFPIERARRPASRVIDHDAFTRWIIEQNNEARRTGRPFKRLAELEREYMGQVAAIRQKKEDPMHLYIRKIQEMRARENAERDTR